MTAAVVDALGTYCPVPLRLVGQALARVAPGDEVTLLADDPLIRVDLVAWCDRRGHELVELTREGDEYRARVRRGR